MILQQEDTLDMAVKENKDLMKDSKKGKPKLQSRLRPEIFLVIFCQNWWITKWLPEQIYCTFYKYLLLYCGLRDLRFIDSHTCYNHATDHQVLSHI